MIRMFVADASHSVVLYLLEPRQVRATSTLLMECPAIFDAFPAKGFSLLWPARHEGLRARHLHVRCDRQVNTLTVILDTNKEVFGIFTPVELESRAALPYIKFDGSLKNFFRAEQSAQCPGMGTTECST
jgi:hypothetical protein